MYESRREAGLSQQDVAAKLGLAQSTLSQLEREHDGSSYVAAFAALYRRSPLWLATGAGDPKETTVAHDLSHHRPTMQLQKLTWEELMHANLNQPFELDVVDDALGPDIYPGCVARFDPAGTPRPGRPVLVRDASGAHYLRDYEQGAAGRWRAVARRPGYAPLDSIEHGLQLVAVMRGVDWP